jgi:alpha-tubulin suppressor-like RCC1 family protein
VKCWGQDDVGQISANGTSSTEYLTPVSTGGVTSVNAVITANWATCALLSNDTVRCWGSSDGGSAGTPIATKTMPSLSGVAQLGSGFCALLSDATVMCWRGVSDTPAAQAGLPANITQVAGNCALSSDGSVYCWGPGAQGQIGNGQTDDQVDPQEVAQLGTAKWIGSGNHHVCAILSDQSFACWGKDGFFDPIDYGPYPLAIDGIGMVAAAAAGFDNTCVIEVDHTVKCWGSNLTGYQLGENGPSGNSATPVVITGLPDGL